MSTINSYGFLIKGKDGELSVGYEIKAYIAEDIKVKVIFRMEVIKT